jgi:hypothetical protein
VTAPQGDETSKIQIPSSRQTWTQFKVRASSFVIYFGMFGGASVKSVQSAVRFLVWVSPRTIPSQGIRPAHGLAMTLHSRSKEQREAVRQLVYLVLTRDMATFNPDRFKHWIKETDSKFRKVGLMLKFEIRDRFVYFRIREIRNGRIIYQFESSTRVPFDERDVVLSYEELSPAGR